MVIVIGINIAISNIAAYLVLYPKAKERPEINISIPEATTAISGGPSSCQIKPNLA